MKRTKSTFLALVAVLLSPMAANADLIMTIDDAGAGQSLFTMSGSATYGTGTGQAPNSIAWVTPTAFGSPLVSTGFCSGTCSYSIASGSLTASSSAGGSGSGSDNLDMWVSDDFGFAPRFNNTRFTIAPGAFVQWSGSLLVNIDISAFNAGSYVTQNMMFGTLLADDNFYRIQVGPASVPEPGTLALLGIGLFGMGLARRRKI